LGVKNEKIQTERRKRATSHEKHLREKKSLAKRGVWGWIGRRNEDNNSLRGQQTGEKRKKVWCSRGGPIGFQRGHRTRGDPGKGKDIRNKKGWDKARPKLSILLQRPSVSGKGRTGRGPRKRWTRTWGRILRVVLIQPITGKDQDKTKKKR